MEEQQQEQIKFSVSDVYKQLVTDTIRTCLDNKIRGFRKAFEEAADTFRILMKRYFNNEMMEFENEWLSKAKSHNDYLVMFERLMVIFQEESEFLPMRTMEGVITDDDVQQADNGGERPLGKGVPKVRMAASKS